MCLECWMKQTYRKKPQSETTVQNSALLLLPISDLSEGYDSCHLRL